MYRRIFFSLCFCVLAIGLTGCVSVDMVGLVSPSLREHEISRDSAFTRNKILVIDISGLIRSGKSRGMFARYTTPNLYRSKAIMEKWAESLRKAGLPE